MTFLAVLIFLKANSKSIFSVRLLFDLYLPIYLSNYQLSIISVCFTVLLADISSYLLFLLSYLLINTNTMLPWMCVAVCMCMYVCVHVVEWRLAV